MVGCFPTSRFFIHLGCLKPFLPIRSSFGCRCPLRNLERELLPLFSLSTFLSSFFVCPTAFSHLLCLPSTLPPSKLCPSCPGLMSVFSLRLLVKFVSSLPHPCYLTIPFQLLPPNPNLTALHNPHYPYSVLFCLSNPVSFYSYNFMFSSVVISRLCNTLPPVFLSFLAASLFKACITPKLSPFKKSLFLNLYFWSTSSKA